MLIATAPAMKRLCISNSVPLRTSMNALKNKYERVKEHMRTRKLTHKDELYFNSQFLGLEQGN